MEPKQVLNLISVNLRFAAESLQKGRLQDAGEHLNKAAFDVQDLAKVLQEKEISESRLAPPVVKDA